VSRHRSANIGQTPPLERYKRSKEENAHWDRRVKEAVQKIGTDKARDKTSGSPNSDTR
jgi:hypothetical protein